jgi:hypothetical protein
MLARRLLGAWCSELSCYRRHGSPDWPGGEGRRYGRAGKSLQPRACNLALANDWNLSR